VTPAELTAQLRFVRGYTNRLLDQTPQQEWFRIPPAGASHVAWQVGHLTMACYRLCLERLRGRLEGDEELMDGSYFTLFGRESRPEGDPSRYPSAAELRAAFDRVHERVLSELAAVDPATLDLPVLRPHDICKTRGDCLLWCAQHEMLHAGQIGLLRRQLGHDPLW
jgi:hypothetical protein